MARHTFLSAVHLIIEREGKILLTRRFNTGYADGFYSLPAGHIDQAESAKTAMCREAKEEVGLNINIDNLDILHVMHRKSEDQERIDFFMIANEYEGEPKISEPDKCDDLIFCDPNNLPQNTIPYIIEALKQINQKKFYSEFGW